MNMKKLIDQTDFQNLNQISKKWKSSKPRDTSPHFDEQKENFAENSGIEVQEPEKKTQKVEATEITRKRNVVPQIIDEDTEHFKNRLEHLLNGFKTDAVSEFMSMKQSMLEYQKESVKTDTQKYLTMYEEKHQELMETKEKLLKMSQQAEKKSAQVDLLSDYVAKLNERIRITKCLSRPFSVLYQNMEEEKMKKFKMKQAIRFDEKRLKRKSMWGWIGTYKKSKQERTKEENEERIEKEVNEIVGKFQKEMEMLKERLAQSLKKNQQYENNKFMLQENLKKAFLRGVTAMNMEAMGVIGTQPQDSKVEEKEEVENSYMNNMSCVENTRSNFNQPVHQSMLLSTQKNNTTVQSSNIMMMNQPKAESKDYKWREAPIMGAEEKCELDEPRMQIVKPTTEGKVIKVIDGRSSVEQKNLKPQSERKQGSALNRKKL